MQWVGMSILPNMEALLASGDIPPRSQSEDEALGVAEQVALVTRTYGKPDTFVRTCYNSYAGRHDAGLVLLGHDEV